MNKCAMQYRKKLAECLQCSSKTRKALLDSFDRSLEYYLEECPEPADKELHAAFGPPEEMAWVLMEGISTQEIARYQARQNLKRVCVCILVVLLLIACVYVYLT